MTRKVLMHLKTLMKVLVLSASYCLVNAGTPSAKVWQSKFNWIKSKEMPELIKKARKRHQTRKLANYNSTDKESMSKEYRELIDNVIAADSPDKIDGLLAKLEKKIDSMPADAKFLGSHLLLMKPFRGIVYRMIPLAGKERITQGFIRNRVKILASNLRIYLPLEHWEAGFNYLTEPYKLKSGEIISQFEDAKERKSVRGSTVKRTYVKEFGAENFQEFIGAEVYPAMAKALERIESISFENPIVWDNKVAFGKDSFKDDFEETRYRKIGEAERHLNISSLHLGMHYLNYLVSYDIRGSISLSKDIGKLYGIDGFFSRNPDGVPSYDWVKVVERKSYDNIGRLRDGYKDNMSLSFKHLQEGVKHLRLAREELRNESPSRLFAINPGTLNPWDENIEKQFKHIECLTSDSTEGTCAIRSAITGKSVVINLREFYQNPPTNLKDYLPTDWNTDKKRMFKKHGKKYPNYLWGTPKSWNVSTYKRFFPELKSDKEIPEYVRTMRQAFGGEAFGVPLALFVE